MTPLHKKILGDVRQRYRSGIVVSSQYPKATLDALTKKGYFIRLGAETSWGRPNDQYWAYQATAKGIGK